MALLVKSVAVVLPVSLLLLDLTHPRVRGPRGRLADKIPFALLAAAGAGLALVSQQPAASSGRTPYLGGDPIATLFTMATVLAGYLRLLLFPTGLSAAYDPPIRVGLDAPVAASLVLLAALVVAGVVLARWRPRLCFWYALFFLGLLPVSQVVPLVTLMNDRYLYVPLLGAAPFAALALLPADPGRAPAWRRVLAGAFCAGLLLLPWLSAQRIPVWRDDVTLWTDASRRAPHSADVWFSLGSSLQDAGRREEADLAYLATLAIDPDHAFARHNLGAGGLVRARLRLEADLAGGTPESQRELVLLGTARLLGEDLGGAAWAYARAAAIGPSSPALFGLGNTHARAGALPQAREAYARAAGVDPHDPRLAYARARVEALAGQPEAALDFLEEALRRGYKDRQMVTRDAALASVRDTARYAALVGRFLPPPRRVVP